MTQPSRLIRDLVRLRKKEIIASWKPRQTKIEQKYHQERAATYYKALKFIRQEIERA